MSTRKTGFQPQVDARTRLVILGSLPGERSLAERRYYAHPSNQFWTLVGMVIDHDLVSLAYADRLAALRGAGIGLWDAVGSARRVGSLDSAIQQHRANPLAEFAANLPALRALAFNGGTAAHIGRRQMTGHPGPELVDLPSSSAAYAAMPLATKAAQWIELRKFLT